MQFNSHQQRFQHYLALLKMPYDDAIQQLRQQSGPVKDDYFNQASYEQFLKGQVRRLQRGNYTRTRDGLCTHHVAENQFHNMSDPATIYYFQYPYRYQQRKALVYVDEVEHLILHALIAKETHGQFGYHGYREFLAKDVWAWYVDHQIPQTGWRQRCYQRALLSAAETRQLFVQLETGPLAALALH
ncbi:hypothetical protein [Lactiplantibacillus modestisalitolerans]|uniref:Uncharacterized protein n=1 Tax=Lactiplantibacillus modestisalitolerans TaxID=1457219 RepID=A0ABV5WWB3_9LACO|nr:hypothetical protein [Lactiplantibacillus modestisalitolerans]